MRPGDCTRTVYLTREVGKRRGVTFLLCIHVCVFYIEELDAAAVCSQAYDSLFSPQMGPQKHFPMT